MKNKKQTIAASLTCLLMSALCVSNSMAQTDNNTQPKTRAEVKAELAALESVGYDPNDWINYPENIQEAQRKLWQKNHPQNVPVAPASISQ
jgi:Holliday junction resolvasome RuvABC DNA-binding subunit